MGAEVALVASGRSRAAAPTVLSNGVCMGLHEVCMHAGRAGALVFDTLLCAARRLRSTDPSAAAPTVTAPVIMAARVLDRRGLGVRWAPTHSAVREYKTARAEPAERRAGEAAPGTLYAVPRRRSRARSAVRPRQRRWSGERD